MHHNMSFWFDIRIYLAIVAVLLCVIAFYNYYAAALGLVILFAMYKYAWERHLKRQQEMTAYLNAMGSQVDQAVNNALQNLPLAIVIINSKGMIHWRNSVLCQWFDETIDPGDSFLELFPNWEPDILLDILWNSKDEEQLTLKHLSRAYHISHKADISEDSAFALPDNQEKSFSNNNLMILYITDITDTELLKTEIKNCQPVLGYVQIDNYDDALKGLTEHQRAAILGKVNEHLADWITELDGFLKKFSEDAYVAVLDRRALDKLMNAGKFEILDNVRSIYEGNKIPLTISMGISSGPASVASLNQAAQAGLEVALGRGGDQTAVDIDGKLKFFGGKAQATEKNTRVRARIVAHTLSELISKADKAIVMGHAEEDFDSLGAAMGIARMVRHMDKTVYIVISKPGLAAKKLSELLLDYEDYSHIFISPEEAQKITNNQTLLFIVDTHRPELVAAPKLIDKTPNRVIIDHHRRAETFIEHPLLVYLEPSASSASELVTELLSYFSDKIELSRAEATALYAGIILDTKNFIIQTGVRTFEAASYLRRAGADPNLVRNMFKIDFDSIKCRSTIIANTETPFDGIAISICPAIEADKRHVVVAQSADTILNIEGMRASFVLFEIDGEIGISARSQGDINVQVILETFGGGGHQSAAGARVKDKSLEEVKALIIDLVSNYIQEDSKKNESNTDPGS